MIDELLSYLLDEIAMDGEDGEWKVSISIESGPWLGFCSCSCSQLAPPTFPWLFGKKKDAEKVSSLILCHHMTRVSIRFLLWTTLPFSDM
jgi:hypothetical protein